MLCTWGELVPVKARQESQGHSRRLDRLGSHFAFLYLVRFIGGLKYGLCQFAKFLA